MTQIAEQVGYADRLTAHKAIKRALDRDYPKQAVEDFRQRETAGL